MPCHFLSGVASPRATLCLVFLTLAGVYLLLALPPTHAQCAVTPFTATGATAEDRLGSSLATWNVWLAAGRPGSAAQAGSVVMLERVAGTWIERATLVAPDAQAGARFGAGVTLDAGVLVVGAPQDSTSAPTAGAVYVFRLIGATWTFEQKLLAADASAAQGLGGAVAVHGARLAAGAPQSGIPGATGAVYLFEHDGASWQFETKIDAGHPEIAPLLAETQLGAAVALAEDLVVCGAPADGPGAGAVYVLARQGPSWTLEARLTAPSTPVANLFGGALAATATRVVVGAPGSGLVGRAYIHERAGGAWPLAATLTAHDPVDTDLFGASVALGDGALGTQVLVGAPEQHVAGIPLGAVYLFRPHAGGWRLERKLTDPAPAALARFGESCAVVPASGGPPLIAETVVGAAQSGTAAPLAGAVHIFACAPRIPFRRADCSADGAHNLADVIVTLSALFPNGAPPVLPCAEACDCNNDGALNIADAICGLSALFGDVTTPPPGPYPVCGFDLTDQADDCAAHAGCAP